MVMHGFHKTTVVYTGSLEKGSNFSSLHSTCTRLSTNKASVLCNLGTPLKYSSGTKVFTIYRNHRVKWNKCCTRHAMPQAVHNIMYVNSLSMGKLYKIIL